MKKYAIIATTIILAIIWMKYAWAEQTLLQRTIEHNNRVYEDCFRTSSWTWTDTEKYRNSTTCWKSKRLNTPSDLYLTVPRYLVDEWKCAISQTEDSHVEAKNGGMYATDLACKFEAQGVYAPDYLDDMKEYIIEEVWYDKLLWNFVILSFKDNPDVRWYFGHSVLDNNWKTWDIVTTWIRFAHADLSWATTGWHTHIELRRMYDGVWQSVRYVTRFKERKLEQTRLASKKSKWLLKWFSESWEVTASGVTTPENIYYFTHYALWDPKQNDASPCISANWQDSCLLQKHWRGTMALTVDIRKKLGIQFWDKVALTWDVGCEGVYTVTDEMACRFRWEYAWSNGPCTYSDGTPTPKTSHVLRPWTPYYIKWDLPGKPGWACSISKLK